MSRLISASSGNGLSSANWTAALLNCFAAAALVNGQTASGRYAGSIFSGSPVSGTLTATIAGPVHPLELFQLISDDFIGRKVTAVVTIVLLEPALQALGLAPDVASFERAHYRAMVVQDLAATPPAADTWWRDYLTGYVAACGVPPERCDHVALQIAEVTRGHAWSHVGTGATSGLQALAALGVPMGVVSNSDGTVEAELRQLGVCYAPDGHGSAGQYVPGGGAPGPTPIPGRGG